MSDDDKLGLFVKRFVRSFQNHPGYLGLTSQGVIAIHADWPVYPTEHGWEVALEALGNFPEGTVFKKLDDIDHCYLLFVGDPGKEKDPYDEKHFHVAIWREDLVELCRRGFVSGVLTDREAVAQLYERLKDLPFNKDRLPVPNLTEYEDDYNEDAVISEEGIQITDDGIKALKLLATRRLGTFQPELLSRVQPLLNLGMYDTSIREGSLLIEMRLKELSGTDLFGQNLIARFISDLKRDGGYIDARLKILRADLRAAFKYVRNEYAHNFKQITYEQCCFILDRISRILRVLAMVKTT